MTYPSIIGVGFGEPADKEYDLYRLMGGKMNYTQWVQSGKPWSDSAGFQDYYDENGYLWKYDAVSGNYERAGYDPTKAVQPNSSQPTLYSLPTGYPQTYTDSKGIQYTWNPYKATYEETGYNPQSTSTGLTPSEQAQLDLERERMAQEQAQSKATLDYYRERDAAERALAEQQRLAEERANPVSWIQYGLDSKTKPPIPSAFLPLMGPDYQKFYDQWNSWWGSQLSDINNVGGGTGTGTTGGTSSPGTAASNTPVTYTGTLPSGMTQQAMDQLMQNAGITDSAVAAALINANRAVAQGTTGNPPALSAQDVKYLQTYMPASYQAYVAQSVPESTQRAYQDYITQTGSNPYPNMTFAEGAKTWAASGGQSVPTVPAGTPGTGTTTLQGTQVSQPSAPAYTPPAYTETTSAQDNGPSPDYYNNLTPQQQEVAMQYVGFGDGGIAWQPTKAILGENGPEAVVPLNISGLPPSSSAYNPPATTAPEAVARLNISGLPPSSSPYNPPATSRPTGVTGLPFLYTPSRQYQARMGPTAYKQLQGYQQAYSGMSPEEFDWRLASIAPSTAKYGITYRR